MCLDVNCFLFISILFSKSNCINNSRKQELKSRAPQLRAITSIDISNFATILQEIRKQEQRVKGKMSNYNKS